MFSNTPTTITHMPYNLSPFGILGQSSFDECYVTNIALKSFTLVKVGPVISRSLMF